MGFEPHSVAESIEFLPAPTEGACPLVCSPRKGRTPFGIPLSWLQIQRREEFGAGDGI